MTAAAYTDVVTGVTYLLVIRNALYIKGIKGNFILPFIIRLTGHELDECQSRVISIRNPELIIPLSLKGITSHIPTRKPMVEESKTYQYIDRTPNTSDWNPYDMNYVDQESCVIDYRGELVPPTTINQSLSDSQVITRAMMNHDDRIDHDTELSMTISSVESSCNPKLLSDLQKTLRYNLRSYRIC